MPAKPKRSPTPKTTFVIQNLPDVRGNYKPKVSDPIAILIGDIHLSHAPPAARSGEVNWYSAMARQLDELRRISRKMGVQIICAGDIFHRWNSPPELINFAIKHLPPMYSVAGQHDIPHHSIGSIHKSAYHTLCEADIITHLKFGAVRPLKKRSISSPAFWNPTEWNIAGASWESNGSESLPEIWNNLPPNTIAVIHAMCYPSDPFKPFPQVDTNSRAYKWASMLRKCKGIRHAHFGDNHQRFACKADDDTITITNSGSFFQRNANDAVPEFYVLCEDGSIRTELFEACEHDVFSPPANSELIDTDAISEFVNNLLDDFNTDVDFHRNLQAAASQFSSGVRKYIEAIVSEALNEKA